MTSTGTITDSRCEADLNFICKITLSAVKSKKQSEEPQETTTVAPPLPFKSDYTYIQSADSYYTVKIVRDGFQLDTQKWMDANASCALDGATLFVPEDRYEAEAVMQFYLEKTELYDVPQRIWIGLSDIEHKGNFTTVDGRSVSNVYNEWVQDFPETKHAENCVLLSNFNLLQDSPCDEKAPVVCKKSISELKRDDPTKYNHFRKDYTFLEGSKSFYKFHSLASWLEANETCASEDAELYYPRNRFEDHLVLNYYYFKYDYAVWVGLYFSSYEYVTIDGEPISSIHPRWLENYPKMYVDVRRCVYMEKDSAEIGNEICNMRLPFICRRSLASWTKETTIIEKGDLAAVPKFQDYVYVEQTKSYYKYARNMTWSEANDTCASYGTQLFMPESKFENDFIMNLYDLYQKYGVWIGITDIAEEGHFVTVDGRAMSSVYHEWVFGIPIDNNRTLNCVDLRSNGTMSLSTCESNLDFICKINLSSVKRQKELDQQKESRRQHFRKDFAYLEGSKSFYKFHSPASWSEANETCASEQAELYYPQSRDDLESRLVSNHYRFQFAYNDIWVGVYYSSDRNQYEIINGQPVIVERPLLFGEANYLEGKKYCVYISKGCNRDMLDDDCNTRRHYICRRRLDSLKNETEEMQNSLENSSKVVSKFRDDYVYVSETGSYYKYWSGRKSWVESNETCISEGAQLFVPESALESDFVLNFFNLTQKYAAWIGVTDIEEEGHFVTVEGKPIPSEYNLWRSGQPSGSAQLNCVLLYYSGTVSDARCDTELDFICEKRVSESKSDIRKSQEPSSYKHFRIDYTFFKETESFYKLHTPATWLEANETCANEGAELYYPRNDPEDHLMSGYYLQFISSELWMGVNHSDKDFHDVYGESVSLRFLKWNSGVVGVPDERKCVYLVYLFNNELRNDDCSSKKHFICRKTPDSLEDENIHVDNDDTNVPSFREDYVYSSYTRSYYKHTGELTTWTKAKETCSSEGALLFVPEDKVEVDHVLNLVNLTQEHATWLGISDIEETGDFVTIDGRSISSVYHERVHEQSGGGRELCVILSHSGHIFNTFCNRTCGFSCKKTVDSIIQENTSISSESDASIM